MDALCNMTIIVCAHYLLKTVKLVESMDENAYATRQVFHQTFAKFRL